MLSVSLYVCLSDDNFQKPWLTKFIFAHLVYLHTILVKFVYEDHWVKVNFTEPKVHNRCSCNGCLRLSTSMHVNFSIVNNSASINTHSGEVRVQRRVISYSRLNGVTAIFLTWPEVTNALAGAHALAYKAILLKWYFKVVLWVHFLVN